MSLVEAGFFDGNQVLGSDRPKGTLRNLNILFALSPPNMHHLYSIARGLEGTKIEHVVTPDSLKWFCGLSFKSQKGRVYGEIAVLFPYISMDKESNKIQPERSIAVYVSGEVHDSMEIQVLLERIELRLLKGLLSSSVCY